MNAERREWTKKPETVNEYFRRITPHAELRSAVDMLQNDITYLINLMRLTFPAKVEELAEIGKHTLEQKGNE